MSQQIKNPNSIHEMRVQSLASLNGLKLCIATSYGVGCNSDLVWLWCRLAAAALIQSLAWELSFAAGMALKKKDYQPPNWFFFCFFCFFVFSRAAPSACGGSQARGLIGAVAASLRHRHGNAGSEPRL